MLLKECITDNMDELNQSEKIIKLEEQQKSMSQKIDDVKDTVIKGFAELKDDLKLNYVSKETFLPVKLVVYGLVGSILLYVISQLLKQFE